MNIPRSFAGGVELFPMKKVQILEVKNGQLPKLALIPWVQHQGSEGTALVEYGDFVQEEQILIKGDGINSVSIHSPVPGRIERVIPYETWSGIKTKAFLISLGGEFHRLGKDVPPEPKQEYNIQMLRDKVLEFGALDSEGYPLSQKLAEDPKKINCVIINSVPKEPYQFNEKVLLQTRWEDLISTVNVLHNVYGEARFVWAYTSEDKKDFNRIKNRCQRLGLDINFVPTRNQYPQGDDSLLIKVLGLNKEDVITYDTLSLHSLFDIINNNKPMVEKYLSITSVDAEPVCLKVRIGTKISTILEDCGVSIENNDQVLVGGPFRGAQIKDLDMPITKDINNLFILEDKHRTKGEEYSCIHCGWCISTCPSRLNPSRLSMLIDADKTEIAFDEGLDLCSFCGICDFVCPSHIPLINKFQDTINASTT
ncbi:4Fe-4S dicluster domain-containing protein [Spirochaeta cellobiosiphila]|uniref:4Fe-4S dicluster domain-containing protein n=1 Tax=Spirochaeta cellobiosiphila TaxID=504483 RepID=UPI0003FEB9A8|nr:4Fe-4S dicluster domain-containing protein [Spirochaeta cellobiosiphila]